MNKIIWVVSVCLAVFTAQIYAQKPAVYPGAVPAHPERTDQFLVRDSYESVKDYYLNKEGIPREENITEETGQKSIFFVFIDRMPDPAGVSVEKMKGASRWVKMIFGKLEKCVEQDFLSEEDLQEIKDQYGDLQNYYYLTTEDGRVDEVIYKKYRAMISSGGNAADLATKAQELMMAGKIDEAKKLLEQAESSAMKSMNLANSPEVVDEWIKCLEEIADSEEYTYPVSIRYSGF
ncbi:MAG: hypothetical protein R6U55_09910 [Desulfovermiculus sp.]